MMRAGQGLARAWAGLCFQVTGDTTVSLQMGTVVVAREDARLTRYRIRSWRRSWCAARMLTLSGRATPRTTAGSAPRCGRGRRGAGLRKGEMSPNRTTDGFTGRSARERGAGPHRQRKVPERYVRFLFPARHQTPIVSEPPATAIGETASRCQCGFRGKGVEGGEGGGRRGRDGRDGVWVGMCGGSISEKGVISSFSRHLTFPSSLVPSSPRSLVLSFPRSLVPTFPRSLVPSSPRSLVPSSPRSLVPSFPRPLVPSSPRSLVPSFPRSLVPSLARSLVRSFARSLVLVSTLSTRSYLRCPRRQRGCAAETG